MRFCGKSVLVTGGASGIGRCVCLAFAREGAKVGVVDVDLYGAGQTLTGIRAAGKEATIFECDVSDPASVETMVDRAVSELGWIDIVVNCAGVREICSFLDLPFEEWKRVIDINLTGTFLCAQRVAQKMVKRGKGGIIVNIASVQGLMGAPLRAAYCASKHGVVGLTKQMALDLSSENIRVNAVAPATVETPLSAARLADQEVALRMKKAFPMGRWGQPEDVVNMILFLCSDEASFLTGAVYLVDGGYSAGKGV